MLFRINTRKIIHETLDGEPVIINLDNGNYYNLDKSASVIWSLIEKGTDINTIIDEITSRYKGSRTDIEDSTSRFLSELQNEDIVLTEAGDPKEITEAPRITSFLSPSKDRPDFDEPVLHKYTDMQGLLLLDPIHEVDETGWPNHRPDSQGN